MGQLALVAVEGIMDFTFCNLVKLFKSIGYMECKGENKIAKEVIDVFRKGKFELLALSETKLKGNGGIS